MLLRPAVVEDGRLVVLEVAPPAGCAPRLEWHGRRFPTTPVAGRLQALVPVPLGTTGSRTVKLACGSVRARFDVPITAGAYPESVLRVDPKFSKPAPPRAAEESAAIGRATATSRAGRTWTEAFGRPAAGPETSPFGVRRTFNGAIESRHRGLDLDGVEGDPVYAANDGVVVLVARDYYFTGNAVLVDHGDELFTLYFHLSRLDVEEGQRVKRGQLLGAIGKTGRVTGPHLHFAVKLAGDYVDPSDLLRFVPGVPLDAVPESAAQPPAAQQVPPG